MLQELGKALYVRTIVRMYERTYASSTMSRHSGAETKMAANVWLAEAQLTYSRSIMSFSEVTI